MPATDYNAIVAQLDDLPDMAIIPDRAAAKALGMSVWTLWRHNPVPAYKTSPRCRGRRVGDIRKLRGNQQPAT
jgi:hypothetical protein